MLTEKEKGILEAIIRFQSEKGYTPSFREICSITSACSSSSTVHRHLKSLEEKGYIYREKSVARAIKIIKTIEK